MPEPLKRDYETTLRIDAPIEAVWDQIETLDRIMRHAPEVDSFELEPGGQRAQWRGRLIAGPFRRDAGGSAELVERVERRSIAYTTTIPVIDTRYSGIFVLASGGEGVTVMGYRGSFVCRHLLASVMRQPLTAVLEDHVLSVPARVAQLAEQHAAFERKMRLRAGGE